MKARAVLEKSYSQRDEATAESLIPFIRVVAHAIADEFLRLKEMNLLEEAMEPMPEADAPPKKIHPARKRRSISSQKDAPSLDESAASMSTRRRKS
jgi:hypothetical protein